MNSKFSDANILRIQRLNYIQLNKSNLINADGLLNNLIFGSIIELNTDKNLIIDIKVNFQF